MLYLLHYTHIVNKIQIKVTSIKPSFFLPSSSSPTNSMDIVLNVHWEVIIHHITAELARVYNSTEVYQYE